MRKTFCDRCGKETKKSILVLFGVIYTKELCVDCLREFKKWMDNK